MHLCVVSPFPPELTGVGQYGWNVVHGLAGTGRFGAITVLAQRAPGAPPHEPTSPTVTTQRVWLPGDWLAGARLAQRIRAARPDVAWFNLGFTIFGSSRPVNFLGLMAPLLVQQAGIPPVVTLHQIVEATPLRTIGAKNGHVTSLGLHTATHLLLRAGAVCVTLRRYQRALQTHYGARNVHHIPLGALAPLEALPAPASPPEDILFFGSPAPFKGLTTLLEAYAQLKARRPQVTLTVAGSDHPRFPGYLAALRASVQARNGSAPTGIRWLGGQPEAALRDLFGRARVVVLPYTATTGASSVLYRAAAFGRPVVTSDLPDLRAAAEEEGLRVDYAPAGQPEALAAALEALLADPERQRADAAHNLEALRCMTLEATCARYLRLFEQAAACSG